MRTTVSGIAAIALILVAFSSSSRAEFDQRVPSQVCTLTFAAECFAPEQGKVFQVSKEALYLSDLYYLCLDIDTVVKNTKPVRVILAIDQTGSMCNTQAHEHNDVNDQRILASHLFLDSLAARSPESQVGTVRFNHNYTLGPYALNSPGAVTALHGEINEAACNPAYTYPKRRAPGGLNKALATSIGSALNVSMVQVDYQYETIFDTHDRHIILLTDGQWNDASRMGPQWLIDNYQSLHPGRELPTIHGVFLSDSAWHVNRGYPAFPFGAEMQQIVAATGGVFIPNAQPHNIVQNLLSILDSISVPVPEELQNVTFTNLTTGETRQTTFQKTAGSENRWEVRLPAFQLQFGMNTFVVTQDISSRTVTDTLRVNRATTTLQNPDLGQFALNCEIDTVHLDIAGSPDTALVDTFIPVIARVKPEEADRFTPGDVTVRAFTQYQASYPQTAALFHLEGNLVNESGGAGTGTPSYSQSDFAFGEQSLSPNQTFQFPIPSGLTTASFTMEAWVKRNYNGQGTLMTNGQFSLSVNAAGNLVLTSDFASFTTAYSVDPNVWQHVALAGTNTAIKIYVNGLEVASQSVTVATAFAGNLTIGSFGGHIDEVRVGTGVRTETVAGVALMRLPTAQTVRWVVNGAPVNAPSATVPGDLWTQGSPGQVEYSVTSSAHAPIIVNMFHPAQGVQWSKNSNPLLFYVKYASLSIESDHTGQQSPRTPNPIGTLSITQYETNKSAYAVIRDSRGHFVEASPITNWSSSNDGVVTVAAGNQAIGEGVVTKQTDDAEAVVTAVNPTHNLSGSVTVRVLGYYWVELRIVVDQATAIDTLTMNTDQDTVLKVQGLRSDDNTWEDASAIWQINPVSPAQQTLVSPGEAGAWPISLASADTGAGWIRVTTNDDNRTQPDSIWYDFSPAPPSQIDIEIITPDARRRAGDTISAVVRIRNLDGLVPGQYCRQSVYTDALPDGGRTPPVLIIDENGMPLNTPSSTGAAAQQCFEDGIDTVQVILYYAPVARDSLHQISVTFDGLNASSQPFHLHPGDLAELRIEDKPGAEIVGPVNLTYPDGSVQMYSRGYDAWGNKIPGDLASNWSADGTLHAVDKGNNSSQIYYTSERAPNNESGYIIARAVSNPAVTDSVAVTITGPKAQLVSATTRDFSGNGYLDAIELQFSKELTLPATAINTMSIQYGTTSFSIDSIRPASGTAATFFTLYLREERATKKPQTDWTPVISISDVEGLAPVANKTTLDGAGPVIWRVVKTVNNADDHTQDLVTVEFSEKILQADGSPLTASLSPHMLFNVWDYNGELDTTMLAGIDGLASWEDTRIRFYMQNGRSLEESDKLNIRTDFEMIADENGVAPVETNQKVRVLIKGDIGEIIIGPNPTTPTSEHSESSLMTHGEEVLDWVRNKQGVVMEVNVTLEGGGDTAGVDNNRIAGQLIIFDAIGNPVYSRRSDNVLIDESGERIVTVTGDNSNVKLRFYWNGITDDQRKSAPGLYRAVLYLEQFIDNGLDSAISKFMGNIGIGRGR